MNSSNIVVSLDTRRAKKDGTYPLILRLSHEGRTIPMPLGIFLHEKDWDEATRSVRKSHAGTSSATRLNNFIQKRKAEAMDALLKLHEQDQAAAFSAKAIKDKISRQEENQSFFRYTDELIKELVFANRAGTARSYRGTASVLKTFNKDRGLRFSDITYGFLAKFDAWHKSKGNEANGLASYMRNIRAIFNKAIKSGLVEKSLYPFDDYKIKTTPTEKRALEAEHLGKIIALELTPEHPCFHARNTFIASYMMYGMNFSDMAHLRKSDLVDGRVNYRRRKTGKLYDIRINEGLQRILSYYTERSPESPHVFPILKREGAVEREKDVLWARKRYNRKLKTLAQLCGIEKNLTSYVSRHSFATQAMMKAVPLNAISAMLGHSSLKTTEIYLKSLPTNVLDDYNAMVVGR